MNNQASTPPNQPHNSLALVGIVQTSSISSINRLLLSNSSNQSSPKNFIQVEHLLSRIDDESSEQVESNDNIWNNTRKNRKENRIKVRLEDERCQIVASLPPIHSRGARKGPPNRPQLFTDLLSDSTSNLGNLSNLSSTSNLSSNQMAQEYHKKTRSSSQEPWRELLSGLGWKLDSSTLSVGNRYILKGQQSATSARSPPNHLILEVVIREVMVLPPPNSLADSTPTPLLSSPSDLLIQIIATVPSEEIWKTLDSSKNSSNESVPAVGVAKMELHRIRTLLRGLVEFRDDET